MEIFVKRILNVLISTRLMAIILLIFAVSIAVATFIENDYGSQTARAVVYNSGWFNALLFLGIINLAGTIITSKLYRREKLSIFIFHLSFLFILTGAAITRFFGFEGFMHIRAGEISNHIISSNTYFRLTVSGSGHEATAGKVVYFSALSQNRHRLRVSIPGRNVTAECIQYIPNDVSAAKEFENRELPDAIIIRINSGGESRSVRYMSYKNVINAPVKVQFADATVSVSFGPKVIQIPFTLSLRQFILKRYPGSNSPSWFESRIELADEDAGLHEPRRIFMNNILKYKGYRFYQSSYDTDEQGTVFSVNHDYAGTLVTYSGYLMLAMGIILSIFNRNSRFGKLSAELSRMRSSGKKTLIISALTAASLFTSLQTSAISAPDSVFIDKAHAARFGELLIQDPGGRIKPVNTLSSELLRKVSGKTIYGEQTPDQVFLGMIAYPEFWQKIPMIRVGHPEIQKLLNINGPYVSFIGVFDMQSDQNPYKLSNYVNTAFQKKPAMRNKFDTEIIRLDERINLCFQVYSGNILRIFPKQDDPNQTWYAPSSLTGVFKNSDSVFVNSIVPLYLKSLNEPAGLKNAIVPDEALSALHNFQLKYGGDLVPSDFKVRLEILYNRINIFDRLGSAYGLIGFVLLIFQFISIFALRVNLRLVMKISGVLIYILFVFHLLGLISRWLISGHAPWSNAYESLVYIAFATILAGLIFSRKSSITLAVTSLLAWLILFVAHLNWMDPQITNLVPVLKSYWLLIHVAIITASYGFLALGALMAFLNLLLMITQTKSNVSSTGRIISEFSMVIEMTMIIGLYMLTIGTFLGGVWANESWGRYWGWDPKETWALVSILVYAFVVHMRLIPGLKGNYIFNLMALLGFSTIIMTYFGVNYYLSGLHSYAKGDPLPVPAFVYYTLAVVGLVAILAWANQRRMVKTWA